MSAPRRMPPGALLALLFLAACSEPGQTEIAKGNVLASRGEVDGAIEAYRAAAAAAPRRARPQELLGHVYFDQQRHAEARVAYEAALKAEPEGSTEARIGLARLDAQEGRTGEAIARLDELLSKEPANVYALLSRANLSIRRGGPEDVERALRDTAEAMRVDGRGAAVLYTRGCAFLAARQPDQATEAFERLEAAHPRSPLASYGLARVAAFQGEETDVIVRLREAKARAKEAGSRSWHPAEVREDPAFRALKDNPELAKVLAD